MAEQAPALAELREAIAAAGPVVVLTGAGMSAEAGVPTFRGPEGLWRKHRPEELATPEAFRRDPRLVWEWYRWRQERIAACEPHAGHRALARFQLRRPDVLLVTQNVDGLHLRALLDVAAGGASDAPVAKAGRSDAADPNTSLPPTVLPREIHGSIFRIRCVRCPHEETRHEPVGFPSGDLPRCPGCAELLRPDVVWFGEPLDMEMLDEAFRTAAAAELCIVVGTSALVHPAASIPTATLRGGGSLLEVNPDETPLSPYARYSVRSGAASALPALLDDPGF